jgi:hypothetical protein
LQLIDNLYSKGWYGLTLKKIHQLKSPAEINRFWGIARQAFLLPKPKTGMTGKKFKREVLKLFQKVDGLTHAKIENLPFF